jgi:hypothetical protein
MHDQPGGKFCDSCAKSVIDLTKFSDQEIIRLIESNRNGFCGRLTKDQLQKTYVPIENSYGSLDLRKVIAGVALLMTFDGGALHSQPIIPEANLFPGKQIEINLLNQEQREVAHSDSLECFIKGVVRDSLTNEPIPFAIIVVSNTDIWAQSGIDGGYSLKMTKSLGADSISFEVSALGYKPFQFILTQQQLPLVKDIYMVQLEENLQIIFGEMVAYPLPDSVATLKITKKELRRMKK